MKSPSTADAVMHTSQAPSDEGAGFLRSKKTRGEIFSSCFSPSVFALRRIHLPHQREAFRCGGTRYSESFLEPPDAPGWWFSLTKKTPRDASFEHPGRFSLFRPKLGPVVFASAAFISPAGTSFPTGGEARPSFPSQKPSRTGAFLPFPAFLLSPLSCRPPAHTHSR